MARQRRGDRDRDLSGYHSGEEGLELGELDLARPVRVNLVDEVFDVDRQPEVVLDDLDQGAPGRSESESERRAS